MQNRYFGDVGDFGKYGLLRLLSGLDGGEKLKLGVVWYLVPDESHNTDGKYISYLQKNDPTFRDCDEQLYDKLRTTLFDEIGLIQTNRQIVSAEQLGLLPVGTLFYSQPLSYPQGKSTSERLSIRKQWFANGLAKTAAADLVFLDPDNGIECASVTRIAGKGPKYVFWDEIDAFIGRGQSVIVYQHLNRSAAHGRQVEDMLGRMSERFKNGYEPFEVTFTRGTCRAYFIISSPRHKDLLRQRISKIRFGPWKRHFRSGTAEGSLPVPLIP